jgi:hypothetical protein
VRESIRDATFLALVVSAIAVATAFSLLQPHYHCSLIDGGRSEAKVEMRTFPLFGDANCQELQNDLTPQPDHLRIRSFKE